MTLPQLQQRIERVKRACANLERTLIRADRIADTCGHPDQAENILLARHVRGNLTVNFTELHRLEARLPTPELLSERAYNRMIALGFEVEAAEAERATIYRTATKASRKLYAKTGRFAHQMPTFAA